MQTAGSASEYAGCLFRTTWARDRESQLDYIAPKTCSIDGDPMLTIGGKIFVRGPEHIRIPRMLTSRLIRASLSDNPPQSYKVHARLLRPRGATLATDRDEPDHAPPERSWRTESKRST